MDFLNYQRNAIKTLRKNNNSSELELARLTLGLVGEAGEVAEKVKKYFRDTNMSEEDRLELTKIVGKELGDCLWYIATLAYHLDISLDWIANDNIKKLADRTNRDKIVGNGDDR